MIPSRPSSTRTSKRYSCNRLIITTIDEKFYDNIEDKNNDNFRSDKGNQSQSKLDALERNVTSKTSITSSSGSKSFCISPFMILMNHSISMLPSEVEAIDFSEGKSLKKSCLSVEHFLASDRGPMITNVNDTALELGSTAASDDSTHENHLEESRDLDSIQKLEDQTDYHDTSSTTFVTMGKLHVQERENHDEKDPSMHPRRLLCDQTEEKCCVPFATLGIHHDDEVPRKAFTRGKIILQLSLVLNFCGFIATLVAAFSLSKSNISLLDAFPFGLANFEGGQTLSLGLLAVLIHSKAPNETPTRIVDFSDFCQTPSIADLLDDCSACSSTSLWMILGFFVTLIAYLPTLSTGFLRVFHADRYDVKCRIISAGLWSISSLLGYFVILVAYYGICLKSLWLLDLQEEKWMVGTGQVFFILGFGLKLIELVGSFCVASSTFKRSKVDWCKYDNRGSEEN